MNFLGLNNKRLNRVSYVVTLVSSMFVFIAIGFMLSSLITLMFGVYDIVNLDSPHPFGLLPMVVLWFVYFSFISVQRFHDMNITGWLTPLVLVPFIGTIFFFLLFFVAGSKGENNFGRSPSGLAIMGLKVGK